MNLSEFSSEIASIAAEVGIDWLQVSRFSPGTYRGSDVPVLDKKYKGTCAYYVSEKGDRTWITFHTFRHGGISRTWVSGRSSGDLKQAAPALNDPKRAEYEKQRRKETYLAYKGAFERALRVKQFEYLARKGIADISQHFDLRISNDSAAWGRGPIKPFICYALYNAGGSYVGLQRIYADGDKKLTKALDDGMYKGAYAVIGDIDAHETVYLAEGFATAASIYLATSKPVVIANNAGNIEPVCRVLLRKWDNKQFVICADNDCGKAGNTGVAAAMEAAREHGLSYLVPPTTEKADFNDFHLASGLAELTEFFRSAKPIKPAKDAVCHLLSLLSVTHRQSISKVVKRLAAAAKVPHYESCESLAEKVRLVIGDRYDHAKVAKAINSVAAAVNGNGRKLSTISSDSVDEVKVFKATSQGNHEVIGDDAVAAMLEEIKAKSLVILRSAMGTGKTERAIKMAIDSFERAAVALPRVSVCGDASSRLGLPLYKNIDEVSVYFTEKMVTCINSLGAARFLATNQVNWFDNLELLCLDEATQALPQITQIGTAERKAQNFNALRAALTSAQSVLIADADANEFLVDRLRVLCPGKRIVLIDVESQSKCWRVNFTDSPKFVMQQAVAAAASGTRCLVATDNRRRAQELEELIREDNPGVRILNIHREPKRKNQAAIKAFYAAPNVEVYNYDVLIYSPAITSGVSIVEPYFEKHFGIFTGNVKAQETLQMMGRDRTAREWLLGVATRKSHAVKFKPEEILPGRLAPFDEFKFSNDTYEEQSRTGFDLLILSMLKLKGHTVHIIGDAKNRLNKAFEQSRKSVAEEIHARKIELILAQGEVTEDQYLELTKNWFPSAEDAAAITAWKVRNDLRAALNQENVEFVLHGGLAKVQLMETVLAPDEVLQKFDRQEEKTHQASLRYYAQEKKRFLSEVFSLLGVAREEFTGEFNHSQCQKVVDFVLQNAAKAHLLFNRIINPERPPKCATTFVMKLLDRLGLKVGKRKSHGRMIRFIEQASVQVMLDHILNRSLHAQGFFEAA